MVETIELDGEKVVQEAIEMVQKILMERPIECEIILAQLLKCYPDHPEGLKLLGVVKQKRCQFRESIEIIKRAIEVDPDCADNYNNLALSYANLDEYHISIDYLNKALELRPDFHLFMNNLALQYRQIGRYDLAIELLTRSIELGNFPQVWCNLGGVYGEMKDLVKAKLCFEEALKLEPDFPPAHVDLAFSYHLAGDWAKGFEHYEWRFEHFEQLQYYKHAFDQQKKWKGVEHQSLRGKRILLYGEQGLGDMIQFVRFVPLLKEAGAHTIVHCAEELGSILARCSGVDEVVIKDIVNLNPEQKFPEYDYQCSLMSLPHLLKSYNFDGKPYIKPLTKLEYEDYKGLFKVGIVWAGSPSHPNDAARSVYLKYFENISHIEGVKLFNLQVNSQNRVYLNTPRKVINYAEGGELVKMVDLTPMIKTFEDTAAVIANLDLIISVDTSLVHLAGAMGVPCWALIQYNPDWRWGLSGDKTPWYDSVRLFRQPALHKWEQLFDTVEQELKDHVFNSLL